MMTGTNLFFLAFSVLIALVGLFAAAAARQDGMSLFGLGLFAFGVLFAYGIVKRVFDAAEAARGRR
ncbi:hypothetical protein [Caldovatus aquaticus]|uniref:NADH dehydrogenase subunit 6 n=1 Tax=Caldovatus aquaticus TaxID=2865671 RepID=A0ABS7F0L4_9PROT|nr:hypothetical protein [Caldovatus aquaticus]MBW8269099.1 hypothetical protein [Caldovatus aquaticus]